MTSTSNSKLEEARKHYQKLLKQQFSVIVTRPTGEKQDKHYFYHKIIGQGSFGIVLLLLDLDDGGLYALKSVYQDPRYYNRELDVLKKIKHENVCELLAYYYSEIRPENSSAEITDNEKKTRKYTLQRNKRKDEYVNLIFTYIQDTFYDLIVNRDNDNFKSLFKQALEAISYLHSQSICHRDIKPTNILVDGSKKLKICDFGSAKVMEDGKANISYICSRFYRAPENLFKMLDYNTKIDVWAIAIVFIELKIGKILFKGKDNEHQKELVLELCDYNVIDMHEMGIADVYKGTGLRRFLMDASCEEDLIDVFARCLVVNPKRRATAEELLKMKYFIEK